MADFRTWLRMHQRDKGFLVWGLTIVSLLPLLWLLLHGQISILTAFLVFAGLLVASAVDISFGLCLALVFLFLLGDLRRIMGVLVGFPKLDPLLLVGPAFSFVIALPLLLRVRLTDSISKAVFALMVVMTLEIFNPRQGPIAVGLAGAIFYLLPLFWFWIGRRYGTNELLSAILYKVVIPLGLLAAVFGYIQTYIGFFPWESAWVTEVSSHYNLHLAQGVIRSFGFSVNGLEFMSLLMVSLTAASAALFAGRRQFIVCLPILAGALFLASSRGALIKCLFAVAVTWALSSAGGRAWKTRLILALAFGFGAAVFSLSHLSVSAPKSGEQTSAAGAAAQHQLLGLKDPLNSKYSTAGLHAHYISLAIITGFKYPIGNGLGSTTLGAGKFGGDEGDASGSSEVDMSDTFLSLGVIGGTLYLATVIIIVKQAIRFGRTADRSVGLPTLGILAALGGAWIAQGQYAIGPLAWFLIGVVARDSARDSALQQRQLFDSGRKPVAFGVSIPTSPV